VDFSFTRHALMLAVGSLLVAGCFSVLCVFGRIPGLAEALSDPQFFKRCLVVHVDLALVVWFLAFGAALFSLLPGNAGSHRALRAGFVAACVGVGAMIAGTLVPQTTPVLSNYVPVIDNPLFVAGLVLFFVGLLPCFVNRRLFATPAELVRSEASAHGLQVTPDVAVALKTTALAYLAAVTTFAIAWAVTPRVLDPKAYYEVVFWGGGHVLQVANVSAMLAVWLLSVGALLRERDFTPNPVGTRFTASQHFRMADGQAEPPAGEPRAPLRGSPSAGSAAGNVGTRWNASLPAMDVGPPRCSPEAAGVLSAGTARLLFALLLIPHLLSPLLTVAGTTSSLYRLGFTRLMQFAIFPVVTVVLGICLHRVWAAWKSGALRRSDLSDARFLGFAASAALTVTGFLIGAAIRSSTTMIPAHYHASIGAVTVAFMAVTYLLLKPVGLPLPSLRLQRLIPWQLGLFGVGQVIFALGFGWGGLHGLGRKTYGAEQHLRTVGEWVGIGVMGAGGLIAVAGGLLFLLIALCAGRPRISPSPAKLKLQPLARSNA
jgi:hypothetical protein